MRSLLLRTLPLILSLPLLLPLAGCRDQAKKTTVDGKAKASADGERAGRRRAAKAKRGARKGGVDLCLFREDRFLCDSGHDGPPAELRVAFGKKGDVPLLGDADGNGTEDPCVWRAGELRCDADHGGEPAEVTWRLGGEGDQPLIGQIVAGGAAEPCAFRDGEWRCLVGGKEASHSFGQAGDVAVLGDVDGDRRDDRCVFRGGNFLCDSAADGGEPEVTLPAGTSEGRPLLADINGDGKDDACVQGPNAVTCTPQGAGRRDRVQLRFAGLKQSVALLGEVGER